MTTRLPLNLQFFADKGGGAGDQADNNNQQTQTNQEQQSAQTVSIDYDKLASIVNGKQTVAEESVLKNFFKNQGMSQEEMTQAIATYKAEKAKNTPDVNALQTMAAEAQKAAQAAILDKEATVMALSLGLDNKTIPYVIKLADLSAAIGEDGKVNQDSVKAAINKVLEDIPNLKPSAQNVGGFQIGAGNNNDNSQKAQQEQLEAIFGIKKK